MTTADEFARVAALLEYFTEASAARDEEQLLTVTAERLRWVIDFDALVVALRPGPSYYCADAGARGIDVRHHDEVDPALTRQLAQTLEAKVPTLSSDTFALACHPLLAGERDVGAILFQRHAAPFTQGDVRIVHQAATFLAGALTRFTHERTVRRQAIELDRFAEANRVKDEFFALLGHELRNPLAPILAAAEFLQDDEFGDQVKGAAQIVSRHGGHLERLLDDLLDSTRLTTDSLSLESEPLQLADVLEQASESVRPTLARRAQRLKVDEVHTPVLVDGDLARLVQVATNLLVNASRYSPRGSEVRAGVTCDGACGVLFVEDDGAGLDAELLDRLFERFVRGSAEQTGGVGGLGLGLALAKSLAERHGGQLSAASDGRGHGSRFELRLPLSTETEPRPAGPDASRGASVAPPRSLRIIVVDDNHDAADFLVILFQRAGHVATALYTGEDALALTGPRPDVWVLDLGLPDMDGVEVGRTIRSRGGEPRTTLIALTGYGQHSDRQRCKEAGFDSHFTKPASAAELLAYIEGDARAFAGD